MSSGINVWLCALSCNKDMADGGGVATIETMTDLGTGDIEQSSLKERALDT